MTEEQRLPRGRRASPTIGYVYLSHPESRLAVHVEPSGHVWPAEEAEIPWYSPDRGEARSILDLSRLVSGTEFSALCWSWENGYLPVLRLIAPDDRRAIRLLVEGDRLYITVRHFTAPLPHTPDPRIQFVSTEVFDHHVRESRAYWDRWFRDAWTVPDDSPIPPRIVQSCLVQARCVYLGRQPKYGAGYYAQAMHDAFPPTTVAMVETLADYRLAGEARAIFGYYLDRFVRPDGQFDYYGPSVSEYGQFLALARKMTIAPEGSIWCRNYLGTFMRQAEYLASLVAQSTAQYRADDLRQGLIVGIPEADEKEEVAVYFHNNAWAWRGLVEFSHLLTDLGRGELADGYSRLAQGLGDRLARAIQESRVGVEGVGPCPRAGLDGRAFHPHVAFDRSTSYAHYRYYPELLETRFLAPPDALNLVRWRLLYGGDYAGSTVMGTPEVHLDNWTLAAYARGLMGLGLKEQFRTSLMGHTFAYLTSDTHTAYEQTTLREFPKTPFADLCVPCQLVTPRLLRWWCEPGLCCFQEKDY